MRTKLERLRLSTTNRPVDFFLYCKTGGHLEMNPPYQRGDVWGTTRRRNLIKSLILGIPIPSIVINDRFSANTGEEVVVIDGKQRVTSILMFMENKLTVPGSWFGYVDEWVTFDDLDIVEKRQFRNCTIGISEGQLKTIEDEMMVFDLINFGGLRQGEMDLPEDSD